MPEHITCASLPHLLRRSSLWNFACVFARQNLLKKGVLAVAILGVLCLVPHAHAQSCMWTSFAEEGDAALNTCSTTMSGLEADYISVNPGDTITVDDSQADGLGVQTNGLGTNFWIAVYVCSSGPCGPSNSAAEGEIYTSLSQLCADSSDVTALGAQAACQSASVITPQGRLTLTSNTPVMASDVIGATNVYYTPYIGNQIPIYDACCSGFSIYTFSQLTMALNSSNQVNNAIYDLFVFLADNSGVVTIGAAPPWATATSRTSGSYTSTELTQLNGLWVNANSFTLTNGTNSYFIPTNAATYVGTIYTTAAGETSMQFKPTPAAGGTGNVLGLYNAYNRVRVISRSMDSTANWNYSATSWRATDGSGTDSGNNNRISFLDGLQQSFVDARNQLVINTSSSSVAGVIGVELDNTTASPGGATGLSFKTSQSSIQAFDHFNPQIGFHYISGVEWASGSTVTFATDSGTTQELKIELEM